MYRKTLTCNNVSGKRCTHLPAALGDQVCFVQHNYVPFALQQPLKLGIDGRQRYLCAYERDKYVIVESCSWLLLLLLLKPQLADTLTLASRTSRTMSTPFTIRFSALKALAIWPGNQLILPMDAEIGTVSAAS